MNSTMMHRSTNNEESYNFDALVGSVISLQWSHLQITWEQVVLPRIRFARASLSFTLFHRSANNGFDFSSSARWIAFEDTHLKLKVQWLKTVLIIWGKIKPRVVLHTTQILKLIKTICLITTLLNMWEKWRYSSKQS